MVYVLFWSSTRRHRRGTVICLVDTGASAERTFLTDSGASLRLGPDDWSDTLLDGVARLHLSGYLLFSEPGRALVPVALAAAHALGVPVSLDPALGRALTELGVDCFLDLIEGWTPLPSRRGVPAHRAARRGGRRGQAEPARPVGDRQAGCGGALVARSGTVSCVSPPARRVAAGQYGRR